ncbi:MAG: rod shape-determining protein MreC [Syntrophomonadaceae bacterium]|nr:rod shape-determining protein MreC [Syntrophomonadaceae bacterium]
MLKLFKNKYFWVAILVIVCSFTVMKITSSHREDITIMENIFRDAFTPLQSGVSEFRHSWGGFTTVFSDKKELSQQLQLLEKENKQLNFENQVLREYKAEARRLQKLLDFEDTNQANFDLLPARVIARSPDNWYRYVIIDKGSKHGLQKGMPVINYDGLVGRIGSVSKNSAQVSLITDREVAVGALLQETRDTNGIIEGIGNINHLRMVNIPYYSKIKKNNRVVTSSLSEIYPKGIYIGKVIDISREPNGLLLSATVQPAVDFDKLEEVLIITAYHPISTDDEVEE